MGIIEQLAEMRSKEAIEEAKREFVENLIKGSEYSSDKIASFANISITFVEKVRQDLRKNSSVK
jgi:hypothetical protein